MGAQLCFNVNYSRDDIERGRIWPVHVWSMVGLRGMDKVVECAETVLHDQIPGDFIETGVW